MEERCQEKALNAGDVENGDTGKEQRAGLVTGVPFLVTAADVQENYDIPSRYF